MEMNKEYRYVKKKNAREDYFLRNYLLLIILFNYIVFSGDNSRRITVYVCWIKWRIRKMIIQLLRH